MYSEEILRYTQDDKENGNNKSVILNEVKNLSVSTTNECRTGLEILRYTQDDIKNKKENNGHTLILTKTKFYGKKAFFSTDSYGSCTLIM